MGLKKAFWLLKFNTLKYLIVFKTCVSHATDHDVNNFYKFRKKNNK